MSVLGRQFHGTYIQGWHPESLPEDLPVHVGTRAAAMDRLGAADMHDHLSSLQDEHPSLQFQHPEMHELEITGRVHPDTFHDSPQLHDYLLHAHPDYDAFRYKNDHEDTGSHSYVVRPSALRVKRTRPIDLQGET